MTRSSMKGDCCMKNRKNYESQLCRYPDVLSTAELKKVLGISSHSTVKKLIDQEKLRCFKLRNTYRFPKTYVLDFMMSDDWIVSLYCKNSIFAVLLIKPKSADREITSYSEIESISPYGLSNISATKSSPNCIISFLRMLMVLLQIYSAAISYNPALTA